MNRVRPRAASANATRFLFLPVALVLTAACGESARHPVTAGLLNGTAASGKADAEPSWGRWFRQLPVNPNRGTTVMTGLNGLLSSILFMRAY